MLMIVLDSVGIPIEGLALILGIDRPLDMLRTVVNVTGDMTVSCFVDNTKNEEIDLLIRVRQTYITLRRIHAIF